MLYTWALELFCITSWVYFIPIVLSCDTVLDAFFFYSLVQKNGTAPLTQRTMLDFYVVVRYLEDDLHSKNTQIEDNIYEKKKIVTDMNMLGGITITQVVVRNHRTHFMIPLLSVLYRHYRPKDKFRALTTHSTVKLAQDGNDEVTGYLLIGNKSFRYDPT